MSEMLIGKKSENVKILVVDELGTFIGKVVEDTSEYVVLKNPLMFNLAQKGLAMASHPLFEDQMTVYKRHLVCESVPKESLYEQYELYALQKRTNIVTATTIPNLKG